MEKRKRGRPQGKISPKTDIVKRVRESLGLTQEQMAAEMECSVFSISKYEGQQTMPTQGRLKAPFEKLAKRAGIEIKGE